MNEIELFFKNFIEYKNYKKLVSVNLVTSYYGNLIPDLESYISFIKNNYSAKKSYKLVVKTNSNYKNKKNEYSFNSQYTIFVDELISYYLECRRNQSIQNIIE
jgi:hypothetical protein